MTWKEFKEMVFPSQNKTECNDKELYELMELASNNYHLMGDEKKEYERLLNSIDKRLEDSNG